MEAPEQNPNAHPSRRDPKPPSRPSVSDLAIGGGAFDRPGATAWYVLAIATMANFFALVDRFGIAVLLQPMKVDLHASDAQLALLSGLAFTVFYTIFGIPIARWVDVGVRKRIMSIAIFTWSALTALSSAATSVLQFGLTRAGVGIAEAAVVPGAVSMVGDLFHRSWRHRALSLFYAGGALVPAIGAPIAAILGAKYGWRSALLALAIGGMVLSGVFWVTVKEPLRGRFDAGISSKKDGAPPIGIVLRAIFTNRALMLHFLSYAFHSVGVGALSTWSAAFAMRVHGLSLRDAGTFTAVAGLVILASIPAGGWICSWLTTRSVDDRPALAFCALAALGAAPPFVIGFAAQAYLPFLVCALLAYCLVFVRTSPAMSLAAEMVPPHVRGMVAAIMLGGSSLLGTGLAQIILGAISDHLTRELGSAEGLRWALLYMIPGPMVLAGILGWWSLRYVEPRARVVAQPSIMLS